MINGISTAIEIDYTEPYCKRAKLDTGTMCNQNCWFCYYQGSLTEITPLEVIKERVDYLVSCGIKEVDLSGGESSLHEDWFEILDYCVSKGMSISTLSNGVMFSDMDFLKKSVEHGLKEILFSLHGDSDRHNKMTGGFGNYKWIIKSINNANELGLLVRINCVVSHMNYKHLDKFSGIIRELNPYEVNFLTLNKWGNTGVITDISYEEITDYIKPCIDRLDFVPIINVRYTPYCFMVGYEKYVCNVYQHIYDIYDWNMSVYSGRLKPEKYIGNELKSLFNDAKKDRINSYKKQPECIKCKYFYICDGIENDIIQEVRPVDGEKIKQVNYYRKGLYENTCVDINP